MIKMNVMEYYDEKCNESFLLKELKKYVNKDVITKMQFLNLIVDMPLQTKEKVLEYFKDDEIMEEILNGRER